MTLPQQRDVPSPLMAHLPVTERWLDVDGLRTSVLEGGQGTPLVLLHGGIQGGAVVWWRVVRRLVEHHRVVLPDLPGLGRSAPLPRLDAGSFAAWLSALLPQTCDAAPTLVAHSTSGGLAARWAVTEGRSLRQLVLVDSAGLAAVRPPPGVLVALLRSQLRPSPAAIQRFLGRVVADLDRTRSAAGAEWVTFVGAVASRAGVPSVRRAMRQLVKAGSKPSSDEELEHLGVPTALVWGRQDPLIPLPIAERASARHDWPLRVLDDAGHLPHVEQPNSFVDALSGLLDGS